MIKATTIYEKLYRQEFVWVHAKSSQEFNEFMRSRINNYDEVVDVDDDDCDGETVSLKVDNSDIIFFWFNTKDPTAIAHELLHATFMCLRARGVTPAPQSDESFCYMVSFLYGEVLKEIKPKKQLTKSK